MAEELPPFLVQRFVLDEMFPHCLRQEIQPVRAMIDVDTFRYVTGGHAGKALDHGIPDGLTVHGGGQVGKLAKVVPIQKRSKLSVEGGMSPGEA